MKASTCSLLKLGSLRSPLSASLLKSPSRIKQSVASEISGTESIHTSRISIALPRSQLRVCVIGLPTTLPLVCDSASYRVHVSLWRPSNHHARPKIKAPYHSFVISFSVSPSAHTKSHISRIKSFLYTSSGSVGRRSTIVFELCKSAILFLIVANSIGRFVFARPSSLQTRSALYCFSRISHSSSGRESSISSNLFAKNPRVSCASASGPNKNTCIDLPMSSLFSTSFISSFFAFLFCTLYKLCSAIIKDGKIIFSPSPLLVSHRCIGRSIYLRKQPCKRVIYNITTSPCPLLCCGIHVLS